MRSSVVLAGLAICVISSECFASTDSLRLHADEPYLRKNNIYIDAYSHSETAFKGEITINIFKYNSKSDSQLVMHSVLTEQKIHAGTRKIGINFSNADSNCFVDRSYLEVFRRTKHVAPGYYKTIMSLRKDTMHYEVVYLSTVDSLLETHSPVRRDISNGLTKGRKYIKLQVSPAADALKNSAGQAFARSEKKIQKAAKRHGLTTRHNDRNGKSYVDLYFEDTYAGRYEVSNKGSLTGQVQRMKKSAKEIKVSSDVNTELGDASLISQFKKINGRREEKKELRGNVSFTTYAANDQEPNSGISNNYYEIRGATDLPLFNLPLEIEGLYTSQDIGREIKSSYVRVHFNPQKLKDELMQTIGTYNSKFASKVSKSAGLERIYKGAIARLENEKAKIVNSNKNPVEVDSAKTGGRDSIDNRIQDIDSKIARYETLLKQYENTKYFDSSVVFAKTGNLQNVQDLSNKKLASLSKDLYPDAKWKKAVSGITNVDAGMFPKNDSRYTMAGQMLKGASAGYDWGVCETSATVGKTEFIGRSGTSDKYTCYSVKTTFHPIESHRFDIIYYGYTADRNLYSRDVFYNKIDISAPGFFNTTHILSANYSGNVSKHITFETEAATSYKNLEGTTLKALPAKENMAYHMGIEGDIPNSYLKLGGEYEHSGRLFENNTLPFSLAGTEQYKLTAKNEFFHSRLSVGIQYNKLIQNNLSLLASNTKWGFDVKTSFRKYPNVGLSYKPFTTFQLPSDTMAIPQRPMFGSVWTARSTYQIKSGDASWRFMVMYNNCTTVIDTSFYGNSTTQSSIMYTGGNYNGSIGFGYTSTAGTGNSNSLSQGSSGQSNFVNLNGTYTHSTSLSFAAGGDLGIAKYGLNRRSLNGSVSIRPSKRPFMFRIVARANTYRLTEQALWRSVYGGNFEFSYRFSARIK